MSDSFSFSEPEIPDHLSNSEGDGSSKIEDSFESVNSTENSISSPKTPVKSLPSVNSSENSISSPKSPVNGLPKQEESVSNASTSPQSFAPRHNVHRILDSDDSEDDSGDLDEGELEEGGAAAASTPRRSSRTSVQVIPSRSPSLEIVTPADESDPQTAADADVDVKKTVDWLTYQAQVDKVKKFETRVAQTLNALRTINLSKLPDKGALIMKSHQDAKTFLKQEKYVLDHMVKSEAAPAPLNASKPTVPTVLNWEDVKAGVGGVIPRTFGKKGMENFKAEKALTMDRLEQIHGSLKTRPAETDLATDPKGLNIELMEHQKHGLSWMMWRESQKPSGGILADDMGLGKTLTVISLLLKAREEAEDDDATRSRSGKYPGGTLIICPASLLNQWTGEVSKRTRRGLISVEVHHGSNRETKPKRLAQYDMVVTTYGLAVSECAKSGPLYGIKWNRIVLDEAHQIRNHKTATSEAVCKLAGKYRWALTGTPVHNKELDMYALFKFLRCSPFDDLTVWRHWVTDKTSGGQERLDTIISSIMLRRTKIEMMAKSEMFALPERKTEIIAVNLDKDEQEVYQRVLIFSRTLFAQFLHQRAAKNQDALEVQMQIKNDPNSEYFKIRDKLLKLNKVREVSQHDILTLILRLRQICCHPSLITKMLEDEDLGEADTPEESQELNLLDQLNNLKLDDEESGENGHAAPMGENASLKEASKGFLQPSHPIFKKERVSSKFKILLDLLSQKLPSGDKAIIVSQWTGLLDLLSFQFHKEGINHGRLDGSVPIKNRMAIVDDFNNPRSKTQVLLLSLTAGGVGLNLVGGNHLILLDLHWNPQLENQAQDRIYRMGQNKPVFVHKLMVVSTIEERVQELQQKKLAIAEAILTGHKQVASSKLNLQDLKSLFGF